MVSDDLIEGAMGAGPEAAVSKDDPTGVLGAIASERAWRSLDRTLRAIELSATVMEDEGAMKARATLAEAVALVNRARQEWVDACAPQTWSDLDAVAQG